MAENEQWERELITKLATAALKEQRESGWSDDDDDIWLALRDPDQAGKPMKERFDVRVLADDPAQGERLVGWLREAGFRCRPLEHLTEEQALAFLTRARAWTSVGLLATIQTRESGAVHDTGHDPSHITLESRVSPRAPRRSGCGREAGPL